MQEQGSTSKFNTRSNTREKRDRSNTDGSIEFTSMTSEMQDDFQLIASSFAPKFKQIVRLELTQEELEILQILAPEEWTIPEIKKGKKKKNPDDPHGTESHPLNDLWEKAKEIVKELSALDTEKEFIYCKDSLLQGTGDIKTLAQVAAKLENGSYLKEGPYSWIKDIRKLFTSAKQVYPANSKIFAVASNLLMRANQLIIELMKQPFHKSRDKGTGLMQKIQETVYEGENMIDNMRSYMQMIQPPVIPGSNAPKDQTLDRNDFGKALDNEEPAEGIQRLFSQYFGEPRQEEEPSDSSSRRPQMDRRKQVVAHFCDVLLAGSANQKVSSGGGKDVEGGDSAVEFNSATLSFNLAQLQPSTRNLVNQYLKTIRYPYRPIRAYSYSNRGFGHHKTMLDPS